MRFGQWLGSVAQRICLVVLLALAMSASVVLWTVPAALAQDVDLTLSEEAAEWERTATRAEAALGAGRASDQALEALRQQLTDWRDRFSAAAGKSTQRIENLRNQIEVLGSAPADGVESAEIASRRQDLNDQLAAVLAPVLAAEEAGSRASGLIAEIDTVLRARQADALISIGPSPINPVDWPRALGDFQSAFKTLRLEVVANLNNELRRFEFRQNLLVIIPLFFLGLVLLLRGRRWVSGLMRRVRPNGGAAAEVATFFMSLANIILPWVGLLLLVLAVLSTSLLGLKGEALVAAIPEWGAIILAAYWLCDRLFPEAPGLPVFTVAEERRPQMRRLGGMLAVSIVLAQATTTFEAVTELGEQAGVAMAFPVLILTSLVLLRLSRVIRALVRSDRGDAVSVGDTERPLAFRMRAVTMLARAASIIAILGPLLMAIGYRNAAEALVYPTAVTAGLLGLMFALQHLAEQIYAWLSRTEGDPSEALLPALVGVALVVFSVPILALIWGVRSTDLTELWTRFVAGVTIGETRISPTDFLAFAMLFGIGYAVTRIVQGALKTSVLPKTRLDQGGQTAVVSGVGYLGLTIAALVAVSGTGLDLSSIALVAGALSVGIGFGLQTIVSNFVSGIILLVERPISEGDWIEVGGQMGYVRDISVRATRIETFDRTDVIIPNADLVSGTVTNYTRGNTVGRLIVPVGVAYGSDTKEVEQILMSIAQAHPMVLANPAPAVLFQGFGADALDFEIRVILRDVNWMLSVRSEMNHEIAARFAAAGLEIPFAQRDIWLRNPEVLQQAASPTAPAQQKSRPTSTDEAKND